MKGFIIGKRGSAMAKNGATHYYENLGFSNKGRSIKVVSFFVRLTLII